MLQIEEIIDLAQMHEPGLTLGWCRAVYPTDDKLWVGFSRIRHQIPRKRQLGRAWLQTRPAHPYRLLRPEPSALCRHLDLEPMGLSAIYSIFPLLNVRLATTTCATFSRSYRSWRLCSAGPSETTRCPTERKVPMNRSIALSAKPLLRLPVFLLAVARLLVFWSMPHRCTRQGNTTLNISVPKQVDVGQPIPITLRVSGASNFA